MKKQFFSSLIAASVATLFATSAFAQTSGIPATSGSTVTIPTAGWTQTAQLVQNLAGNSLSNGTAALAILKDSSGNLLANNWDLAVQKATATAGQVIAQDGLSSVIDSGKAQVGASADVTQMAMQTSAITHGMTFDMTSKVLGVDKAGGATLLSQVSSASNAGQVQAKDASGNLLTNADGTPKMVDTTSTAGYSAMVDPAGNGSAAWFGTNQKATMDSLVGAAGQTSGSGSFTLSGSQSGAGSIKSGGVLSTPATGSTIAGGPAIAEQPSATVLASMTANHNVALSLATAVNNTPGTSMGSFVSQNTSKVDQTFLAGTQVIKP